ncbi:hypothetical protein [Pontibaca salina]|uniref:Uncharacterized protein n=1 Tax=Pontibaca salina TaxID=2795731 RepID=A0A934HHS1_9RHOB|nr:hypothetical protein [Pontibaca salina]MBI6628399.1 hypothetical protein [Pontibaca salina]
MPVRRRRVLFIPGYDPFPPRRYRELYRRESAAQAAISGYDLAVTCEARGGIYGWHVEAQIDGVTTETDVEVLVWSDIVQSSMANGIATTYLQLLRTAWTYIASGALWRLMRLRKGPVIAAFYPVVLLLAQLALAMLAAVLAFPMLGRLQALGTIGQGAALVATGLVVWGVLRWFRAQDGRFYAHYLMHDYAFSARQNGANPLEIEQRIADFAARIAEALAAEVDEVLVVGHSSGAHLGVSVLADLLRSGRMPINGPALSFLTLGQVVPMVSFLPDADRLRTDLRYLSARDELTWGDVSAPSDGCSFALCDPVAVSGVAPEDKKWPLVLSAAFTKTLSPERWKTLRWRFFRLHLQYLCAFDRPGDYDYFHITAGPLTLGARYAGRAPSRSRIDVPVSRHVSVRPA